MYMTIIFKDLLIKTAWQINVKFNVELQWEDGRNVYINGSGHKTKMDAMPIYGKTIKMPEVL